MVPFIRSIFTKVASGSSLRARLARATVWMLVGSGLNQAFAMLASIGTARILGKVAFGEFGAVRSTVMTMAVLAGGGLGLATTRYVAALRHQDPERAGRLIRLVLSMAWAMTLVAAAACALLARPIAVQVMRSENLTVPLMISALAIVFSTVAGVQIGVMAGCEAFRPVALMLTLEGFSAGALMVAGAWFGGVTGAVLGYVIGTFIAYLLRQRQVKIACEHAGIPMVALRRSDVRAEVPFIVSAVIPSMLLVIGAQPAEWLARVLLVRGPEGMAALGLFTAAYSWAQLVQFVPSQISGPALTLLSNLVGAGDWTAFRRLLIESAGMVFGAAAVIAIPLALLSRFVMGLYGPEFRDGAAVFSVIVLAYAFGSVQTMFRTTFLAAQREWLQLAFTLAWGIALPVSFLLQGRRTAMTLALSYGISFLLVVLAQLVTAWFLFRGSRKTAAVHEGAR
jgi:O-antigen/teichoic acid export membrane protein